MKTDITMHYILMFSYELRTGGWELVEHDYCITAHNSKGQLIEVFINQCSNEDRMYWVVKIDHINHTDIEEYKYIGTIWEDMNTLEGIFICFN